MGTEAAVHFVWVSHPRSGQRDGVLVRLWARSHRPIPHLIRLSELACWPFYCSDSFRNRTYRATANNTLSILGWLPERLNNYSLCFLYHWFDLVVTLYQVLKLCTVLWIVNRTDILKANWRHYMNSEQLFRIN
jgi:hypothetical protein